jgi:DNA-binding HxlR family transcriptional regulator
LEANKIIKRTAFLTVPPKVEYSLTDFGKSLEPILEQLIRVGEHYISFQKKEGMEK